MGDTGLLEGTNKEVKWLYWFDCPPPPVFHLCNWKRASFQALASRRHKYEGEGRMERSEAPPPDIRLSASGSRVAQPPDVGPPGGILSEREEAQEDEPGRLRCLLCVSSS